MEIKPWIFEKELPLSDDFTLILRMDHWAVYELENLYAPKGMLELLEEVMKAGSVMTQFLWFMTRRHHSKEGPLFLNHDMVAGLQYSDKYGKLVVAALGSIVAQAFKLDLVQPEKEVVSG